MPKIKLKRGLKTNLPIFDEGEPGFTTDTEEFFVGSKDGNIQLAKQTDLDVTNVQVTNNTSTLNNLVNVNPNAEVLDARGTYSTLGNRLNASDVSLAEILQQTNNTVTYTKDVNGNYQTITEKDVNGNTVKTVTYTYNTAGDVTTSVTVMNGKTTTTTYNYDANGDITSTANVLS